MIIILVDDLGWQDTSLSFGLKEKVTGRHFRTPNLEKLAARGLTVKQAYSASPVSTPSRASLLSGLSPDRTRIMNWVSTGGDTDPNHPSHGKFAWAS
jgi:arylsulfatase A-like enzyme